MTRWLKELKPTSIDDIMWPWSRSIGRGLWNLFQVCAAQTQPVTGRISRSAHGKYLKASFGLSSTRMTVLLTALEIAGYDWMEADKFRKAIGKKIPAEMEKQKIKFFQGCRSNGKLAEEKIEELWRLIEPFAAYGFNKAHAASYGIIAYQTSYMKAHYPVQYMTAVLQAEAGDTDKVAAIVHECRRMNIEVLPPDVNESFRNFAMVSKPGESGRIRFGLTTIKNVGEDICEVIYQERKDRGPYRDLENFLERIQDKDLNKKSLESLAQSGALDSFGHDRGVMMANIETCSFYSACQRKRETKQHSLFSGTAIAMDTKLLEAAAGDARRQIALRKQLLGVYIPLIRFSNTKNSASRALTPPGTRRLWSGLRIVVGGVIASCCANRRKKAGS